MWIEAVCRTEQKAMVARYMTLYAMEYAATAVTPSRATIATGTSAPPCRTVKSADIGRPVRRVRRSAAPVASEGRTAAASRSSAFRRRARGPTARATQRHRPVGHDGALIQPSRAFRYARHCSVNFCGVVCSTSRSAPSTAPARFLWSPTAR